MAGGLVVILSSFCDYSLFFFLSITVHYYLFNVRHVHTRHIRFIIDVDQDYQRFFLHANYSGSHECDDSRTTTFPSSFTSNSKTDFIDFLTKSYAQIWIFKQLRVQFRQIVF